MKAVSEDELAGADFLLSIVPPADAVSLAERFSRPTPIRGNAGLVMVQEVMVQEAREGMASSPRMTIQMIAERSKRELRIACDSNASLVTAKSADAMAAARWGVSRSKVDGE